MNILKNKNIAILGLGNHGGGASAVRFSHSNCAKKIAIFDNAGAEPMARMLYPLRDIQDSIHVAPYDSNLIKNYDIVIKNPAVPRSSEMVTPHSHIETDISLFFQYMSIPTWMITGTKGKSSVSTALYKLLSKNIDACISLSGNITSSPLNIIVQKQDPKFLVLELSSFQLGDLRLVKKLPFHNMQTMILTNVLPDHLNYYTSMKEYTADKLFPFAHLHEQGTAILPYHPSHVTLHKEKIRVAMHDNALELPKEQCVFHSATPLPPECAGTWVDDKGVWAQHGQEDSPCVRVPSSSLPAHIPKSNISIISSICAFQNHVNIPLPTTKQEWEDIFTIPHRKEYLGSINARNFYNDSAATIPEAMQLSLFAPRPVLLIAGGTDKNIDIATFVDACAHAKKIYLLQGNFTEKLLPVLGTTNIDYEGPYSSLEGAVRRAYKDSKTHETIVLSPGCASFEMFLNEFDRGDQFKKIYHALATE